MDIKALPNCTCFNLRKAARSVTQAYDDALKPTRLRVTQFTLMSVLTKRGPSGITELAKALGMDRTTLTRNLRPLENQGFLTIVAGADRRQREISISPAGRAKLAEAQPLWLEVQNQFVEKLGIERWANLLQDLEKVTRQS